jgi:hypothetical protein
VIFVQLTTALVWAVMLENEEMVDYILSLEAIDIDKADGVLFV